ncbi:MAG TPA: hypothetical protein ENI20_15650 [Bacteroides sp.]|nr:hypothetical protein [Bacteroides sp.]
MKNRLQYGIALIICLLALAEANESQANIAAGSVSYLDPFLLDHAPVTVINGYFELACPSEQIVNKEVLYTNPENERDWAIRVYTVQCRDGTGTRIR